MSRTITTTTTGPQAAAALRLKRRIALRAAIAVALAVATMRPSAPAPALAADLYWDINGSTAGGSNTNTANGTWGVNPFWSGSTSGSASTGAWVAGSTANFCAGVNVTGVSSVGVSGTQTAAGLTFEEGTITLSGSGTIALNSAQPTITIGAGTEPRAAVINAALSAPNRVAIARGMTDPAAAATLTLSGNNTLGGGVSVGEGVRINANTSTALGGAGGGSILVTGSDALFACNIASLALTSINLENDFALNPAGSPAAGFNTRFAAAGNISGSYRLTFGGDISGAADVILSAAPTGSTTAAGAGMTVFSGTNSYQGQTIINLAAGGSFQLGAASALPAGTALSFGRGQSDGLSAGIMDLAGRSITIASLTSNLSGVAGVHGITNSSATPSGITVTGAGAGAGAAATTFTGVIGALSTASMSNFGFSGTDNLALTLAAAHAGSLTLSGANTYSGATTINGGTLVVAHTATDAATIAGNVIVNSGARLASASGVGAGGSGGAGTPTTATIGGGVTLNDGGIVDPGGAGVGVLHIAGGMTINSDTAATGGKLIFNLESTSSYDRIDLGASALTLDDGFHPVEINALPGGGGGAVGVGTYTLMTFGSRAFDGVHGFTKSADPGGGFSYALDFTDTALRLIVTSSTTQSLAWDIGGGGPPITEGSGTWADGSGNFSDLATNAGATFSNAASADVTFGNDAGASGGTIVLAGDVRTGGKLIFGPINPAATYTISAGAGGAGAGGHVLTTAGGITANSSAMIAAPVALEAPQAWQVASGRTLSVSGNISGAVALTKSGAGTLALGGMNDIGGLQVDDGVVMITGGATKVANLAIAADAKLDLRDNKLITNNAAGVASAGIYNGLQGEVQRAYDFNAWDLPGLTTSMPDAAAGLTTIGIATGEQMRGLGPTDTDTFAGQTITGASTVAMYTYAGDANLDGVIDGGDYGVIDNFVQVPGADSYANGDFNYDGVIDGGDYGVIDNNIQAQGAPFPISAPLSITAVPEPACVAWLILSATSVLPRHRRRRRRDQRHRGR